MKLKIILLFLLKNMSSNNTMSVSEDEKIKIMKAIEDKTEKILIKAISTGKIEKPTNLILGNLNKEKVDSSESLLVNIMKHGAVDFEQKVGRPMTYSEMREMYG